MVNDQISNNGFQYFARNTEKRYAAIISDFSLVILFKNRTDSRSLPLAKDVTIFQTHIVKEHQRGWQCISSFLDYFR